MKKPQKTPQEERSRATRERLIQATIDCIVERGFAQASTAEISERAGVSSGARVHHFRSKMDLVVAATAFTYDQAADDSIAAASDPATLKDPLRAFVGDTYRLYSGPRFLMQHEVISAARTSDELMQCIRPVADRFRQTVTKVWLDVFLRAGHSQQWATAAMELTIMMVRGLALSSRLRPRTKDDDILALWLSVMSRYPDERKAKGAHVTSSAAGRA
jgi:AcrR family transcriptional regulator